MQANLRKLEPGPSPNAISQAVGRIASQLNASAIMTLTNNRGDRSQRNRKNFVPQNLPFWRSLPHVNVARQLQLVWGVRPLLVLDLPLYHPRPSRRAMNRGQGKSYAAGWRPGGGLSCGHATGVSGSTDLIKGRRRNGWCWGVGVGIGDRHRQWGEKKKRARVAPTRRLDVSDFNDEEILVVPSTKASTL